MTEILDIGVPSGRTLTAGVGLAGGGTLSADRTFTVAVPQINGFRLTLTTALPVTTADVTGATTIYLTPYKGGMIALYDGAAWALYSSAEISLALGTLTSGLPYDVFAYNNAGTLTLELLAWTNGTTRATALARTNGVWLKTGDLTRRYVGTLYTTSTTATEDSEAKRFVFNADNRARRSMRVLEPVDFWTYSSETMRAANNNTANRIQFVVGLNEDGVEATVQTFGNNGDGVTRRSVVAIGLDSTSVASSAGIYGSYLSTAAYGQLVARYAGYPGIGFHFLQWLERGGPGVSQTWYGDDGGDTQAGIVGSILS